MIAHSRNSSNDQENILLRSATEGDSEALGQLFSRYMPQLYRTALRLLKNPDDAEDALQDSLLAALRSLGGFQGRAHVSSWLTRIVVNSCLMQLRRRRCVLMTSIDTQPNSDFLPLAAALVDSGADPEEIWAQQEQREMLVNVLSSLQPKYLQPLWLRYFEGLSYQEVAEDQEISKGCLKTRLHRARQKLRTKVVKYQPLRQFTARNSIA